MFGLSADKLLPVNNASVEYDHGANQRQQRCNFAGVVRYMTGCQINVSACAGAAIAWFQPEQVFWGDEEAKTARRLAEIFLTSKAGHLIKPFNMLRLAAIEH